MVGTVMVVAAVVLGAVGVFIDIRLSEREKGTNGLWGEFRPVSWRGLAFGLPFYVAAIVLLVLAP